MSGSLSRYRETRKALGGIALWGTIQTHGVMEGFMRYEIGNHPGISAEYVKFLVHNTRVEAVDGLMESSDALDLEAAELRSELEADKKIAK